jgi:LPS-assembly protein
LFRPRFTPLALAAGLMVGAGLARAQPEATPAAAVELEPSRILQGLPRGEASRQLPTILQAERIRTQLDLETVAEGNVEFRRGGLVIRADRLGYDSAQDLATAKGHVRVSQGGATYTGPEMQLQVQRFEGYFLQPEFQFSQLGAGGRAERIDFIDGTRSRAMGAEYTSCVREGTDEPAWFLRADAVRLDLDANEGVAEGAVLRFLGVPILAVPSLSFPLTDARRSGWLPPSFDSDSRSGIELSAPYYWNIAPNRDATFVPRVITRRGLGLNSEFRYLEPGAQGLAQIDWLPSDRLTGTSREAVVWKHDSTLAGPVRFTADLIHVSDDDWWKDFPNGGRSLSPRLLPVRLGLERPVLLGSMEGSVYARVLRWQVLQGSDATVFSPYQRSPQIGVRGGGQSGDWQYAVEGEFNRFTLPIGDATRNGRVGGDRVHLLGYLSRPFREPGWWLVPRVSVNAAAYGASSALPDGARRAGRVIPSFSLDAGLEFERRIQSFGRELRQTLEPRVLLVQTPYHAQSQLPNYDAAAKDFNFISIYSDNQFSGVDRVNDSNALTAGVTTRFLDAVSGAEAMRLGLVQRYLFRNQQVTAQADGTPDGVPVDQRFSDALLLGSTTVLPGWTLDSALQYSPDIRRSVRSVIGVRYSPGPLRTVSTTYRLTRGLTEQVELGWQWPVWSSQPASERGKSASDGRCGGTWYAVGRINYSLRDSRMTDAVLGTEYDAGCWIGRLVAERLSTGLSEATTRLMFQLELVGLSRIGSNPLQVLKDNIPGYRLLREERRTASPSDDRPIAPAYD